MKYSNYLATGQTEQNKHNDIPVPKIVFKWTARHCNQEVQGSNVGSERVYSDSFYELSQSIHANDTIPSTGRDHFQFLPKSLFTNPPNRK